MMTEETAKSLIEALNRFSGALEKLHGGGMLTGGGIHIYHHGIPQAPTYQPVYPSTAPFPITCNSFAGMNQ